MEELKVLCTADFHMSDVLANFLRSILEEEEVDVVVNAGDFLSERYANHIADIIEKAGVRGVFVEGNWDDNLLIESRNVKKLSNSFYKIRGYTFYGVDEKIFLDTQDLLMSTQGIDGKKLIFVTHEPPRGIRDKIWSGANVGNSIYREYVEVKRPLLHCFGHIHEDNGIIKRGETLFVNAAMADIPRAYLVTLPSLRIKTLEMKKKV